MRLTVTLPRKHLDCVTNAIESEGEQAASQLQAPLNSGAVTMTSIDRDRDV
jgi:hypothetical protein